METNAFMLQKSRTESCIRFNYESKRKQSSDDATPSKRTTLPQKCLWSRKGDNLGHVAKSRCKLHQEVRTKGEFHQHRSNRRFTELQLFLTFG